MATQDVQKVYDEVKQAFGLVPTWVKEIPPQALPGFWSLQRDLELGDTKIPNKYKELIGVAVAGATRCRYCALFHTEAARLNGATDEEIAEAGMFAGLTMAASTFVNANQTDYDQFRRETLQVVENIKRQSGAQPRRPQAQA